MYKKKKVTNDNIVCNTNQFDVQIKIALSFCPNVIDYIAPPVKLSISEEIYTLSGLNVLQLNLCFVAGAICFSIAQPRVLINKSSTYYSYKTSNDLEREETGEVVNVGREDEHIVVRGFYSYIDVNGEVQRVMYTADENGYQPSTSIDSVGNFIT